MPDKSFPPADSPLPPELLAFTSPSTGFLASDFMERLEQAWIAWRKDKERPVPDLMEFLPAESGLRDRILPPLAEVHFEYGLEDGQWDRVEAFLERYPGLKSHVEVLTALIGLENRHRRDNGETVGDEEYWRRFPPFAALQVRDDFEKALREGKSPVIEEFLQNPLVPRPLVLQHLVALDLTERLKRREHVRLEEYLARFPELPTEPDVLADFLLIEYGGRADFESDIPFAEYESRFPTTYPILARRLHIPRIEGFTILSQLGFGGMGKVYKAREDRLGGRLVAVKVILASALQRPDAMQRFQQEVNATAQVEHPNIARVYQVGEYQTEDGGTLPYLVMEYVPLGTLAAAMGGQPQNQRDAAETVECLALAVHAAHQRGIVHRDLKPQNVLLGPEPKITDFGLAKLLNEDIDLTRDRIAGTPSYMAPEQWRPRQPITAATDVWALGVILYEMLTGRPPFQSPRQQSDAGHEPSDRAATADRSAKKPPHVRQGQSSLSHSILHDAPVRPRRLDKGIDPHLEAICLKCLEKSPKDRFSSADALAQELRRFLNHDRPTIKPVTRWSDFRRWCRRRPAVAALAVSLVLVVLVALGVSTTLAIIAARNAAEARRNEDTANTNARIAEDSAKKETLQRKRAELQLYAEHLRSAQKAWEDGEVQIAWDHLDACQWNLRGWEYDHVYSQFTKGRQLLYTHQTPVTCIAVSSDGTRIASGDYDVVKLWDVATQAALATIRPDTKGTEDCVACLAFSPDSTRIAAGFDSGTVIVWDLTGHIEHTLSGHADRVSCVSFGPDGKRIVSCGHDKTARVWDATTGNLIHTLSGHQDTIVIAAFSPDGKSLATGCQDGQILLWNVTSGEQMGSLEAGNGQVHAMSFHSDGKLLSAMHGHCIAIWSLETATRIDEWQLPGWLFDKFCCAAFGPKADCIAVSTGRWGITVWGTDGAEQGPIARLQDEAAVCLAFSPDDQRIFSGCCDNTIKLWDLTVRPESLDVGAVQYCRLRCMALSSDGSRVATSLNKTTEEVSIWNTLTGERLATLGDSSSPQVETTPAVFDLALSSNGKIVATALQDKTIRLWRIADQKKIATFRGHTDFVLCVAFSSDGKYLASGSADNTVRLWDLGTNSNILVLRGHEVPIVAVAFSPDGRRCASGSRDGTVRLWDVMSGKELATLRGHTGSVVHLAFSHDGRQLASESLDGALKVWDMTIGRSAPESRLTIWRPDENVWGVAFSPDGTRVLNGLTVYDAETGVKLCEPPSLWKVVSDDTNVQLSADGKCLALAGEEQVQLRIADSRQQVLTLPLYHNKVDTVSTSPDGTRIASGCGQMVLLSDATTGEQITRLCGHTFDVVVCSAFNQDGRLLATGSEDNTAIIWDVESGRKRWTLSGHGYTARKKLLHKGPEGTTVVTWDDTGPKRCTVCFVGFSADRKHAITGSQDGTVKLWDLTTGKEVSTVITQEPGFNSVAMSPDGQYIATGVSNGEVRFWSTSTGEILATLPGHTDAVVCIAFSPDGGRIATGSHDKTIRLWDVATGRERAVLQGHSDHVTSVAFSLDGNRLVSGSADTTLILWDAQTGGQLQRLYGHTNVVSSVAFSPDGSRVISGSWDERVKVWVLPGFLGSDASRDIEARR